MSDKDEILSLLNLYSYTIDGGDLKSFTALYEKGEWNIEGLPPNRGAQAIFDNVMSKVIIYDDGTPRTRHINTNIEIAIDEKNETAKVQRYVTLIQQTETLPLQVIFSGHYHDEFVKEEGKWRFAKTVVTKPLIGDGSQHLRD